MISIVFAPQWKLSTLFSVVRFSWASPNSLIDAQITRNIYAKNLWDTTLESLLSTRHATFTIMSSSMVGGVRQWNSAFPDEPLHPPTGWDELMKAYEQACLRGVYREENRPRTWRMAVLGDLVLRSFYFDVYSRTRRQSEDSCRIPKRYHPGSTCAPGKRRPYVKVDGTILPCERVPSDDQYFKIGSVHDGISLTKVKTMLREFTELTGEDCKNCWIQRMCSVGCSRDVVENGIPVKEKKTRACRMARERRHWELVKMCTLLEKDETALDHFREVMVS